MQKSTKIGTMRKTPGPRTECSLPRRSTIAFSHCRAITIAFDEALETASADSIGFYRVAEGIKKRKQIVFSKSVKISSISYDGSRAVTVRLAKPVKGPVRLIVSPGIMATDGTASNQEYTVTID